MQSSQIRHQHRQQGPRQPHHQGTTTYRTTNNLKLAELQRSSVRWNSDRPDAHVALTDRLQELLVFELHQDGSRKYMHLSVRGLYKYVLSAITTSARDAVDAEIQPEIPAEDEGIQGAAATTTHTEQVLISTPLPAAINEEESHHDEQDLLEQQRENPQPPPPPTQSILKTTEESSSSSNKRQFYHNKRIPRGSVRRVVHNNGDQHHHQQQRDQVTYRERLGGYLHPRDMRRLVTPFSTTNEPELIVRRHVMLLNFDPLRAIILRDRLLVLVPDGADSLLVKLEQRVRGGSAEVEDSIFGWSGKDDRLNGSEHGSESNVGSKKRKFLLSGLLNRSSGSAADDVPTKIEHEKGEPQRSTSGLTEDEGEETEIQSDIASEEANEWHEMEAREWINLPFELQCADAVLHVVGTILSEDTMELQEAAMDYIDRILHAHSHGMQDDPLTIIRVVKDATQLMMARVKGFVQSLSRILDEDEDMALMNLSRLLTHPERFIQPVPQQVLDEESDEPELILEANLQIGLTLMNYLDLIQGQINTAKELVDQKQDQTRNRLLFAQMMISVFSLCTALASLIGSFLGMNVPSGLEEDVTVFREIVFGTVAGAIGMCFFIMSILYYSGTIPRTKARVVAL